MRRTTIVVPCYNEAERLDRHAFETFAGQNDDIGFLFVDDGSTDDTLAIIQRLAEGNPSQFSVHPLARNSGKAEAVRLGLLAASAGGAIYAGFWDADLATPLDEITGFIELLDTRSQLEMVFGSRVNLLGRSVRRNLLRHYIGRAFATAAASALGVALYDSQCGAKLFRVSPRFNALLRDRFIGGWIFDVEIVAREIRARRGTQLPDVRQIIFEQPLMTWRDVKGSKIKATDFPSVALKLAHIYWKYLRQ